MPVSDQARVRVLRESLDILEAGPGEDSTYQERVNGLQLLNKAPP
jgi:hypothetical protein